MDDKTVEQLEAKVEEAIAEVIGKMGVKRLPLLPLQRTMHLMPSSSKACRQTVFTTEVMMPRFENGLASK